MKPCIRILEFDERNRTAQLVFPLPDGFSNHEKVTSYLNRIEEHVLSARHVRQCRV